MIALDTNLLVYAHHAEFPQHRRAFELVRNTAEGTEPWGIPWPCLGEFVSTVTNSRWFEPPSTMKEAVDQLDTWLASPTLRLLGERQATWPHFRALLTSTGPWRARVHDARIAAICLDHGVEELWTAGRDFSRFPQLHTRNPILGSDG